MKVSVLQGWVSIHRKIMNNPVWQDPKLFKLWMLCLLEATHKEHEQLVGKQIVKLQPGQFVTGRFSLAKSYNEGVKKKDIVPEITLWRWLKLLETGDFLNIKTTTKYSVVTINNWHMYQSNEQQMNNKRTTNEQQMITNNNVNNDNNDNKKTFRQKQVYDEESISFKLAKYLHESIKKNMPEHKEPNIQSWANEIRKIIELDNRDPKQVAKVIKWAQNDSFWWKNILSPSKLRKQYDVLIANIRSKSNQKEVIAQQKQKDARDKEIEFQRFIADGGVPDEFDWRK